MEMAKRLGGVGEVIRIATERMIVGEVNASCQKMDADL